MNSTPTRKKSRTLSEKKREKEGGMGVARMKKMERSMDQFVEKF